MYANRLYLLVIIGGAMSSKRKLFSGLIVLVFIFGTLYINFSVYPFTSQKPNFADVERVFNRMQFPAEWQEIRSSENRGIAGRRCPIEPGSACFHKGKTFAIPSDIKNVLIEEVIKQSRCDSVGFTRQKPIGGDPYTNFTCSAEGLEISGTIYERQGKWEISVTVYS